MFHAQTPVENNHTRLKMVENNRGGKAAVGAVEKKPPLGGFFNHHGQRRLKLKTVESIFQPDGQPGAVKHRACCEAWL